jgi:hypothetical protein
MSVRTGADGGRGWPAHRVVVAMLAHGSQAGLLLARGGRCDSIDVTVVC